MEFTFHNSYIILELVPSTLIFWKELFLSAITDKTFTTIAYELHDSVLQETGTAYHSRAHGFTPGFVFGGVHVADYFSFLCSVFCFICLRSIS